MSSTNFAACIDCKGVGVLQGIKAERMGWDEFSRYEYLNPQGVQELRAQRQASGFTWLAESFPQSVVCKSRPQSSKQSSSGSNQGEASGGGRHENSGEVISEGDGEMLEQVYQVP